MWRHRLIDLALLACLPLIIFACSVVREGIHRAGYVSLPNLLLALFDLLLKLAVPGLMLVALIQLVIALYSRKLKHRLFVERTVMCLVVYAGAVACGWLVYSPGSNLEIFVRGFRDRLTDDVDLAELRRWHSEQTSSPPPSDFMLPTSDLPADVQCLRPNTVFRDRDTVHISWGSGFGHWGVTITPTGASLENDASYAVVLQAAPAIYVWHDQQ